MKSDARPLTPAMMRAIIEKWWIDCYPENGGVVPYLSGEWHHSRDAMDELIRRFDAAITQKGD